MAIQNEICHSNHGGPTKCAMCAPFWIKFMAMSTLMNPRTVMLGVGACHKKSLEVGHSWSLLHESLGWPWPGTAFVATTTQMFGRGERKIAITIIHFGDLLDSLCMDAPFGRVGRGKGKKISCSSVDENKWEEPNAPWDSFIKTSCNNWKWKMGKREKGVERKCGAMG